MRVTTEVERAPLVGAALLQPLSRFQKPKGSRGSRASLRAGQAELYRGTQTYQGRASTLLQKLSEIESKIQGRSARRGTGRSAAQQVLVDEELSWSELSQGPEPGAGGLRFLETGTKPKATPGPGADPGRSKPLSYGEEDSPGPSLDQRQGSISHYGPRRKPFQNSQLSVPARTPPSPIERPSSPGKSSLKRFLHRPPSPPSRSTPVHNGGSSPSLSSSITDSLAGRASPGANGSSLSEGICVIRSLEELFVGTAGSQGSSSSDFQEHVLSLADLAPSMAGQKEGVTEEATVMEASGNVSTELPQNLFFGDTQSTPKSPVGKAEAPEEEEPGETEISEQLSGSSRDEGERPPHAQHSDDFDSLPEDTQRPSASKESQEGVDASLQAGLPAPSSPGRPPLGNKRAQSARRRRRITSKDVAVQTNSSSLSPQGFKPAAAASTMGWSAEGAPHTGSPVASLRALEELTTYRPAVAALNDILKQNLQLIQQFVAISHHFHLSFVALLEEEEFHYHTLEEAKRYIDHHKHSPLTTEQTLHKLEEQKEMAV